MSYSFSLSLSLSLSQLSPLHPDVEELAFRYVRTAFLYRSYCCAPGSLNVICSGILVRYGTYSDSVVIVLLILRILPGSLKLRRLCLLEF